MFVEKSIKEIFQNQQSVLAIQVLFFALIISTLVIVGTVVYNKTSIYDKEDVLLKQRTIDSGFKDLQRAVGD